ncbi:MAG: hypothetical protein J5922_05410 [Clostridia bacterium]|nr:hypothetical protein [Clostridia bacterium]
MGFGLLFVGYLFLFNFPLHNFFGIDSIPDLIGYVVMCVGIFKLSNYIDKFKAAKPIIFPMIVFASARSAISVLSYLDFDVPAALCDVLWTVEAVLIILLHYVILEGIFDIAKETELKKISIRAKRNEICLAIYALSLAVIKLFATAAVFWSWVKTVTLLFGIWLILLCAMLIFSSYMWICLPKDLDMKPREFKISKK